MKLTRQHFHVFILIVICFLFADTEVVNAQSSGLRFLGQGHALNERTSLELFPKKPYAYSNQLSIEFDLSFVKGYDSYFGYIFRMHNEDGVIIDMIYEDLHDPLKDNRLNVILGNNQLLFSIPLSLEYLYNWNHLKIDFDDLNKRYSFQIGDYKIGEKADFSPLKGELSVFFGSNLHPPHESSDLPNMKIRDITITQDHKKSLHWPLNNMKGTITLDDRKKRKAQVTNPVWLYAGHTSWELAHHFPLKGNAQFTYDHNNNRFFLMTRDSLISFTAGTGDNFKKTGFRSPINLLQGQHLLYDSIHGNLLRYSVEQQLVVNYDIDQNRWDRDFPEQKRLTGYWHQNKAILPQDTSLILIGGYGHHAYKNSVFTVNLESGDWDSAQFDNGVFGPRYLAGLGGNTTGDTLYIMGGYGSLLGEQKFDPHYWNELLRYIPSSQKMERVVTYDHSQKSGFCFANSFVINGDGFYALSFSKFDQDNTLQLLKGSLHSSQIEPVGEKVPFLFDDINSFTTETFVDLFYSEQDECLYAAVSLFHEKNETNIKIYSLNFPPKSITTTGTDEKMSKAWLYLLSVILFLTLFLLTLYIIRKKRRFFRQENSPDQVNSNETPGQSGSADNSNSVHARILLFGGFQVFDDRGKDITGMFTPTLKEMFLLIFLNSFGDRKGVSSQNLRTELWSDKNEKDSRNNSSVNISRLRAILSQVGDSAVSKDTGYWKINIDYSKVDVDYAYFSNIVHTPSCDQKMIFKLVEITRDSSFLRNISNEWLDPFKAEVSNDTVDKLINWATENSENSDPASIIPLADAILDFDPIDEVAIELKCKSLVKLGKHSLAKNTFDAFAKEYNQLYGEDFKKTFKTLIE